MATDQTQLTSDGPGPEPDSTPAPEPSGTEPSTTDSGSSPQVTLEELQSQLERERTGRAGAQRQMETERRARESLERELAYHRGQRQQQPQGPAWDASGLTPQETKALADAHITGDYNTVHQIETMKSQRLVQMAENRVYQNMGRVSEVAQRNQSFQSYLNSKADILNPDTAIARKVAANYDRLMHDPQMAFVDRTPYELPNGGVIFPSFLVKAVDEAEKELGIKKTEAKEEARSSSDHFTEPARSSSGGAAPGDNKSKGFNPMVHLSESERAMADDLKKNDPTYSYKRMFENMKPGMREARLKQGRPVSQRDLRR